MKLKINMRKNRLKRINFNRFFLTTSLVFLLILKDKLANPIILLISLKETSKFKIKMGQISSNQNQLEDGKYFTIKTNSIQIKC